MTYHTRIYVPLSKEAWSALLERSKQERREPRMQASYDLEQLLVLQKSEETGANLGGSPVSSVRTA